MCEKNEGMLVFQEAPVIELAANIFTNVPIIMQYDKTPLIEVVREVNVGFNIEIPIYHSDGTYLAKVKGSQIYPTDDGIKAGVKLRHPDKMTVCEIDGRTVFEVERQEAAALKTQAELYTPDASFIRCSNSDLAGYVLDDDESQLQIGVLMPQGEYIDGFRIGIHILKDGGVNLFCK
ncbi:MAG: hypothetical protein FVQ82_01480 [Planctomycetes bacterium]|nr:hypothetical protein [Planctomycetota bacterium]